MKTKAFIFKWNKCNYISCLPVCFLVLIAAHCYPWMYWIHPCLSPVLCPYVLSGQFILKHLKIPCEININKKGRREWEMSSFKTLKIKWQIKANSPKLLRIRFRIYFGENFSDNHHILEKQDSQSNKNMVMKRRNIIVVYKIHV